MYKIIRNTEAKTRTIADNKTATNYITKDISKDISFATTKATVYRLKRN